MVGKPDIKRTRITVELMLEKLAYQGIDEILLGKVLAATYNHDTTEVAADPVH